MTPLRHHRHLACCLLLLGMLPGARAAAAPQAATAPASQAAAAPASQPASSGGQPAMHWAQRMGVRSLQVTRGAPLIDRVVLVPDTATYVDELRKWSPRGRWPVLIEDDVLTPMFVRRFQPAQLVRREPVAARLPDDRAQRRHEFESIVVSAFGGDPAASGMRDIFDRAKYTPPGVVVASTEDPAWTAALALAAGRAEPLVWIDGDLGAVNAELSDAAARKLAGDIEGGIDALHYSYRALGDDIDVITLCRSLPVAARLNLPDEQRLLKSGQYADGTISVSDFIGRAADGSRWAFTGWIFGDEKRCAYMAMCSLFLPRERSDLLNTYSDEGEWGHYSMTGAAQMLTQAGLAVQHHAGATEMSESGWRRLLIGGLNGDAIWMNSGGNSDYFILNGGQTHACDVPVLNAPAALHLIHSWSLRAPTQADTVGARWLDHGAYAMVGSCFEPFLAAFVPPQALAARCLGGVPLLVAARHWPEEGELAKPWRIVTIGDPLMLLPPVAALKVARVAPPPVTEGSVDLLTHVRDVMKQADDTGDIGAFVEAVRILDMLGKDDIAIQMWRLAMQKNVHSGRVASAALPALFRQRDTDGFMQAWTEGGPRTPLLLDMFWHLMQPRLAEAGATDLLLQMQAAVRPSDPASDVERLAPQLLRGFGKAHVEQFIGRQLAQTKDAEQTRRLREIAAKY